MSSAEESAEAKVLWRLLIAAELLVICGFALFYGLNPEMGWLIASLGLLGSIVNIATAQRRRVALAWTTLAWPAGFLACCFLGPFRYRAGEPAWKAQCKNRLMQITLALGNYHDTYRSFPPACMTDSNGKAMHSWRVLLLPFLEEKKLYEQYDFSQPWDSADNQRLLTQRSSIADNYACPKGQGKAGNFTNYLAVVGAETAWPGTRPVTLKEITDGPKNTIIIVEVADSDIQWTEPRDLSIEDALAGINAEKTHVISSRHAVLVGCFRDEVGAHVSFGDGTVRFLPEGLAGDDLHSMLTRAGNDGGLPALAPSFRSDTARVRSLITSLTVVPIADLIFVITAIMLLRREKPLTIADSAKAME